MRGPVQIRQAFVVVPILPLLLLAGCEQDPVEVLKWTQAQVDVSNGRTTLKYVSMRETDVKLRRLDFQLGGTPVDIDGMIYTESDVTDEGLMYLGRVTQLDLLHFSDCRRVGNRGLMFVLGNNPGLIELGIVNTRMTDAALADIATFTELRRLSVSGISDEGLGYVAGLSSLQELQLVDCQINESGARSLSRLGRLKKLEIFRCHMLESVEHQLKRLIPGCRIVVNPL